MIQKLCIIGIGRIGKVLVDGLINSGFNKTNLILIVKTIQKRDHLRAEGYKSEIDLLKVKDVDFIFLAVKVSSIEAILASIKQNPNLYYKPIVSLCAGFTYKNFQEVLNNDYPVLRIRPNIFIGINKGNILLANNINTKLINKEIESLLQNLGAIYRVDESELSKLTWDSSSICGVILSQLIISRLNGLPSEKLNLVSQMIVSSLNGFCKYLEYLDQKGIKDIAMFQHIYENIVSPEGLNYKTINFLIEKQFFNNFLEAATYYERCEQKEITNLEE